MFQKPVDLDLCKGLISHQEKTRIRSFQKHMVWEHCHAGVKIYIFRGRISLDDIPPSREPMRSLFNTD
jgi:hypothetical protein